LKFASAGTFSVKELTRLRDRFKSQYPAIDEIRTWQFVIGNEGSTTPSVLQGFKLTASNAVDVLLINLQSFGTARLAPYPGWEYLIDLSQRNFEGLVKVVGIRHRLPWPQSSARLTRRLCRKSSDLCRRKVGTNRPDRT
jgi:uncharacterized protein (TIGR04255 family)